MAAICKIQGFVVKLRRSTGCHVLVETHVLCILDITVSVIDSAIIHDVSQSLVQVAGKLPATSFPIISSQRFNSLLIILKDDGDILAIIRTYIELSTSAMF